MSKNFQFGENYMKADVIVLNISQFQFTIFFIFLRATAHSAKRVMAILSVSLSHVTDRQTLSVCLLRAGTVHRGMKIRSS